MLTKEQTRHYLFEICHEADLVEHLHCRFQDAAVEWLRAHHARKVGNTVAWSGIASEREMQVSIEGILSTFARISLFLFPERSSGQDGVARGVCLRELLGVGDDHPIGNRVLRNHWMHLDERLDRALRNDGEVPVGYQLALGRDVTDAQKRKTFRLVDPSDESVYILGERFDLRSLVGSVMHVSQQAALTLVDGRPAGPVPHERCSDEHGSDKRVV